MNFWILYRPSENSSIITSDAEIYKKVPAEIAKKIASIITLMPLNTIPNIIPIGVVSEKMNRRTNKTSFSILDLFKFIPY